jgi:hypothetical protein
MTAARICLALVAGRQLPQELFDYLSEQTDVIPGFTRLRCGPDTGRLFGCTLPTPTPTPSPRRQLSCLGRVFAFKAQCVAHFFLFGPQISERL